MEEKEEVEEHGFILKITKSSARVYCIRYTKKPKLVWIIKKVKKLSAYDLAEIIANVLIKHELDTYDGSAEIDPALIGRMDFDEVFGSEIALSIAKKICSIEVVDIDKVERTIERINQAYEEEIEDKDD
ncbi:MAG: hypothetical protein ACP5HJ_03485 [Candidatus Micrarchaeia archaeon]